MITSWQRTRSVEVRFDDDLRTIAYRELGDASRWTELVVLNDLVPPYISKEGGNRVLKPGDFIRVPAQDKFLVPVDPFLSDLRVQDGDLVVSSGKVQTVGGVENFVQSIRRRLLVARGELPFHPKYGSFLPQMIGMRGTGLASLAAQYARESVLQDFRVRSAKVRASVSGDRLAVTVEATPVAGDAVKIGVLVE